MSGFRSDKGGSEFGFGSAAMDDHSYRSREAERKEGMTRATRGGKMEGQTLRNLKE